MTTIIISILAALGIGGGVMIASNGGGGGGSSSAVVAPANPGGSSGGEQIGGGGGSSGGGNSGGQTNPNLPTVSPFIENGSTSSITTLGPTSKNNTTLENKTLTIGVAAFVPYLVTQLPYASLQGTWYSFPQSFVGWGDGSYLAKYGSSPNMQISFNLNQISSQSDFADFYQHTSATPNTMPLSQFYLNIPTGEGNSYFLQLKGSTWNFTSASLALGGRKLGLKNSDFGYYVWTTGITGGYVEGYPYIPYEQYIRSKSRGEQFYMFDKSKQLVGQEFKNRYPNNRATFTGTVIGLQHEEHSNCNTGYSNYNLTGNITLSLNFNLVSNKRTFSGAITNVMVGDKTWYDLNLSGEIYLPNLGAQTPNMQIKSVSYNTGQTNSITGYKLNGEGLKKLSSDNLFGTAAIVKGSNPSEDELVGGIAFVGKVDKDTHIFNYLAFGSTYTQPQ
jgi:Predicted membrane protein